jgi:GrpB-like predicted nucleotidyltransferase (UPF0157 family)
LAAFERDFSEQLAGAEVHHIGATALPFRHTKGDVDANVRVEDSRFTELVAALSECIAIAQPDNWSESFASFSTDAYDLPLGVQVTSKGTKDDFLLGLRDRMRSDPALLRRYDQAKLAAAAAGADAYWAAKNAILSDLLAE